MKWLCLLVVLLGTPLCASAADTPFVPRFDPFQKPDLVPIITPEQVAAAPPAEPEVPELPELRAILHSTRGTLVNLNGVLIEVGGRYDSYQVAAAGDHDVVLLLDDQTFTVTMRKEHGNNVRLKY